jgi:hypothetical protein
MEFFLRQVYPWLIEVSSFSPVLPFIAGLLLLNSRKSRQFRLFFFYVILIIAVEAASQLTVYFGTTNNLWLGHVYTPIEFCTIAAIYYCSFKQPAFKRGILITAGGFVLFSVANIYWIESLTEMNSVARMVENSLLIMLAVLYFYKISNDLTITYLDRDPIFLLSCGILLYKSGTTMSYAMFNAALAESYDAARICLSIVMVLNILYHSSLIFVLRRAA